MTRSELQAIFVRNQVPTWCYSFGGAGGGDLFALEPLAGKWMPSYYTERRSREQEAIYDTESDSCLGLLAKVSDTLRELQHRDMVID